MDSNEQVFNYIKDEIENLTKNKVELILAEAKQLENEAYAKIRQEAEQDAAEQLKKDLAELNSKASLDSSKDVETGMQNLVKVRETYVEDIFAEAKAKLMDFVSGDEYADYLINKVAEIGKKYQLADSVIYLRQADLSLKDKIMAAYGQDVQVAADPAITIGGFILENKRTNLILDESIDFNLENQRDWFYKTSGLMIK